MTVIIPHIVASAKMLHVVFARVVKTGNFIKNEAKNYTNLILPVQTQTAL